MPNKWKLPLTLSVLRLTSVKQFPRRQIFSTVRHFSLTLPLSHLTLPLSLSEIRSMRAGFETRLTNRPLQNREKNHQHPLYSTVHCTVYTFNSSPDCFPAESLFSEHGYWALNSWPRQCWSVWMYICGSMRT